MATGLQPPLEPAVAMEQHAAATDHYRRGCHVGELCVPIERVGQHDQLIEDDRSRLVLAIVPGPMITYVHHQACDLRVYVSGQAGLGHGHIIAGSAALCRVGNAERANLVVEPRRRRSSSKLVGRSG